MTLYTVLIVDDEAFIVDWLSNILEETSEFSLDIYRAYSPLKAIEIMERTRIDLLITDIQMPNTTGFELTNKLISIWPNSKAILLTAYSDFHYAQQAIKMGILGYVLKTATDTEILDAIRNALLVIEKEHNQVSLIKHLERDLKNFHSQLNRQLFFYLLNGFYQSSSDLENTLNSLGFSNSEESSFALIVSTTMLSNKQDNMQIDSLIKPFQIQRLTSHYLEPYVIHSSFEISNQMLVGIIQLNTSKHQCLSFIRGALELAQTTCFETLGSSVSYLISPIGSAKELHGYWACARSLVAQFADQDNYIYFFGNQTLSEDNDFCSNGNSAALLKSSYYNAMKRYLENGEKDSLMEALKNVCDYLSQNVNWHNNICLQIYFSLLLVFITHINKQNLSTEIAFHTSTGTLFRPWLLDSWKAVEDQLFHLADTLINFQIEAKNKSINNIIQTIQDYIVSHVTEDISLMDLSDVTGYSCSYLSKYYSDATGSTISQFIAEQKLKKINELMLSSNLNIGEIAISMGFHSRTYFNNYMKRLTGMSPQQYRKFLIDTL